MEQIEREVGERLVRAFLKRSLQVGKARGAALVQDDDFAIEDRALGSNVFELLRDRPHAVRPVQAGASKKPHTRPVFADLNAVAIELQLVKPARSSRRIAGRQRKFRRDERRQRLFRSLAECRSQPRRIFRLSSSLRSSLRPAFLRQREACRCDTTPCLWPCPSSSRHDLRCARSGRCRVR